MAPKDFIMDRCVGSCANSFGISIYCHFYQAGAYKGSFGQGGFIRKGDTVGCGLMVVQHEAIQRTRLIFFTKNGKIWGNN